MQYLPSIELAAKIHPFWDKQQIIYAMIDDV